MEVLWTADQAMTAGEVHRVLPSERPLAYTTVMTVLVRLWKKNAVQRQKHGRAYSYAPSESRAEFTSRRMHEMLETAGDTSAALASFVGAFGPKDLDALKELIQGSSPK